MHPNAARIRDLYSALDRHDVEAIVDCYDVDAHFSDIAFDLEGREKILEMWRMISSGDIRVTIRSVEATEVSGVAKIIDDYTFRETKRHVRNMIESHFRFRDGRILDHREDCNPRVWAEMALGGPKGFFAGRFRFLRAWKARSILQNFARNRTS